MSDITQLIYDAVFIKANKEIKNVEFYDRYTVCNLIERAVDLKVNIPIGEVIISELNMRLSSEG